MVSPLGIRAALKLKRDNMAKLHSFQNHLHIHWDSLLVISGMVLFIILLVVLAASGAFLSTQFLQYTK